MHGRCLFFLDFSYSRNASFCDSWVAECVSARTVRRDRRRAPLRYTPPEKGPAAMEHAETRRLAAIMFTDIVGFSRQMGANEARMLRLLAVHNQFVQRAVADHHGIVIKTI